jgi:hypothetical protein
MLAGTRHRKMAMIKNLNLGVNLPEHVSQILNDAISYTAARADLFQTVKCVYSEHEIQIITLNR